MQNKWKTLTRDIRYDNPWIQVTHREVINPTGGRGIYGVVHFKNWAIGVVPIDADGYTWLVGQYRYPLDCYSWEIPEGGCPVGENPLLAAQRELREETGLAAGRWTKLLDFHLSNSVSDEYGILYLAEDLTPGEAEPEDTEDLQLRRLPLAEAIDMVMRGEITDAMSVMALQRVALMRRGVAG